MLTFLPLLLLLATTEASADLKVSPAQARNELRKITADIIRNSGQAAEHDEWHRLDLQTQNLKSLLFSQRYSEKSRCEQLKSLSAPELLSFYDEIIVSRKAQIQDCRASLTETIHDYLNYKRKRLAQTYRETANKILTPCSKQPSDFFGPAEELVIDQRQGGVINGSHHPQCKLTFTFDDGPHPKLTPKLLESLAAEQLNVNFFVVGYRVTAARQLLRDMNDGGHVIGNHTQNHKNLRQLSLEEATNEIENGFNRIHEALGFYLPFFRFPYGNFTSQLRNYLTHLSRVEFMWNIDTRDWATKDPEELYVNSLKFIERTQRGIVLMHDIQPQTIVVVPYLLSALKEAGYSPLLLVPNAP
jgi:peptidoglycan/xylan/chitin deacetylase (PgdA/CDA1 family)